MRKLTFIWDKRKNEINKMKHNLSFEEAKTVFYDDEAILSDDPEHSIDKENCGIPYQTLINLYLCDCAENSRELQLSWK